MPLRWFNDNVPPAIFHKQRVFLPAHKLIVERSL